MLKRDGEMVAIEGFFDSSFVFAKRMVIGWVWVSVDGYPRYRSVSQMG